MRQPDPSRVIQFNNDTPKHRAYNLIEYAVLSETRRLRDLPNSIGVGKAEVIETALRRLAAAIFIQDHADEIADASHEYRKGDIVVAAAKEADLSTVNLMLDFKVASWSVTNRAFTNNLSLRETLNTPRYNPLTIWLPAFIWGPLWGKAESLQHVEETLARKSKQLA